MNNMSIRIKKLIDENHLSYGELSELTEIPKSALQRYATGETENIPLDRIVKMADALHSTPEYIMGWEDSEKKKNAPIDEALITSDVIRRALGNLTEEQYQDVLEYARFLKSKRDGK